VAYIRFFTDCNSHISLDVTYSWWIGFPGCFELCPLVSRFTFSSTIFSRWDIELLILSLHYSALWMLLISAARLEGFWRKCNKKTCFAFPYRLASFRLKTGFQSKCWVFNLRPTEQVIWNINASKIFPKRHATSNPCWKLMFGRTWGF
jgi:hypothetical protein